MIKDSILDGFAAKRGEQAKGARTSQGPNVNYDAIQGG